jgi:hypothetical protein
MRVVPVFKPNIFMGSNTNIGLIASGELFGFDADFCIAKIAGELQIIGSLNTKGKQLSDLFNNKRLGISKITKKVTIPQSSGKGLAISFAKKSDNYAFLAQSSGISCGIMLDRESKQLLLALNTKELKNGNDFEQYVAKAAEWAKISSLFIIVRNATSNDSYSLLKKLAGASVLIPDIPTDYESFQLLAVGTFDLNKTNFGECVSTLTGLNQLKFAVGGNYSSDKTFEGQLTSEKIETGNFTIENLSFGLQKSSNSFCCIAAGTFIFKLDNNNIGFRLSGAVSNKLFVLSAASLSGTELPLNSRLSFSDLALSIGVVGGKVSFGMIGRLKTSNLSIFAGFAISPPKISLLTAAITSTTGRVSLSDLITEIADIQWDPVQYLDCIAVSDFELGDVKLSDDKVKFSDFPSDNKKVDFQEKKTQVETSVKANFNRVIDKSLAISSECELTPLGEMQFILTDKGTMRHYRIDSAGRISLNCQIYICTQAIQLGSYKMPVGFFMCGTLEFFSVKARFLFQVEKGKSLVALVQIREINILGGMFTLSGSKKPLPIQPIDGGLAGSLVKQGAANDLVMYLNVQKDKGELTCYLSARITILKIFEFDSFVVIKDRMALINVEYSLYGFKVIISLQGGAKDFATSGFKASISFDTSGFSDLLKEAQEELKKAIEEVASSIKKAEEDLCRAQSSVSNLDRQIRDFDAKIARSRDYIRSAKWYQVWKKIAGAAEIVAYEIAKAGIRVAIGVAYAALEVAKTALNLGGVVVGTVLKSLAYLLEQITNLLWINSFKLGIEVSPSTQKILAELNLTVLGKNVLLEGALTLNAEGLLDTVKDFIRNKLKEQFAKLVSSAKQGNVTREIGEVPEIDMQFITEYCDLNKNNERYTELLKLRDSMDELLIDVSDAYFDAYNEENIVAREDICNISVLRMEEEMVRSQHCDAFDAEFVGDLTEVVDKIRGENVNNRTNESDNFEKKMDELVNITKGLANENGMNRAAGRESLFSRLENRGEANRKAKRTRAAESEISASEANEKYATDLSNLIELHFRDNNDPISEELKTTLAVAIYDFRNPDNGFRKQKNNDRDDDDDDFI